MSDVQWKADIFAQLRVRNNDERDNYLKPFRSYTQSLEKNKVLSSRNLQLEQQLRNDQTSITSRGNGGATMPGDSNEAVAALEEKLAKAQKQLVESLRMQSEHAETILLIKERREEDENARLKHEEEIIELKKKLKDKEAKYEEANVKIGQLQETVTLLHTELKSTKEQLEFSHKKAGQLAEENSQLIDRMLQLKQGQAAEMNAMNAMYQKVLDDQKQQMERQKMNDVVDMSDESSILDSVAWQSYFNVSVPKSIKVRMRAHQGQATSVRYNQKGTLLVSCGSHGCNHIWNARTRTIQGTLSDSSSSVMIAHFSPDDKLLLTAGNDKIGRLWSMETGRVKYRFVGHAKKLYAADFSPCENICITGSHDMTLRTWDIERGELLKTIPCQSSCNGLSVSPNGNMVASAHLDCSVRLWSLHTGEMMHELKDLHDQQATAVIFSPDGFHVLTNSKDNRPRLIDMRTFRVVKELVGSKNDPYRNGVNWGRMAFSPDGQYIVGGSYGGIHIWEADTGRVDSVLKTSGPVSGSKDEIKMEDYITSVDWNRNGRQVACCNNRGEVIFFEP